MFSGGPDDPESFFLGFVDPDELQHHAGGSGRSFRGFLEAGFEVGGPILTGSADNACDQRENEKRQD